MPARGPSTAINPLAEIGRAHRALIVRELKGLQDIIELSVVHPHMGKGALRFGVDDR